MKVPRRTFNHRWVMQEEEVEDEVEEGCSLWFRFNLWPNTLLKAKSKQGFYYRKY